MVRNLLALTGVGAIALASAIGIHAYGGRDDLDAPPRIAVSYAGLDLTAPAGLRILEQRINAAIADVCPADSALSLSARRSERQCREQAIAGVRPQVDAAVADAEARMGYADDRYADAGAARGYPRDDRWSGHAEPVENWTGGHDQADSYRPVPPAPPPPPAPPLQADRAAALPPPPGMRLIRRTVVTTRTVTTGSTEQPSVALRPMVSTTKVSSFAKPNRTPVRDRTYARTATVPGSYLPSYAWSAIERATLSAFRTGRTTPWRARERAGYVTVSAARWIKGCKCRNVRAVKRADGRQIVVAEGLRCQDRAGRLTGRH